MFYLTDIAVNILNSLSHLINCHSHENTLMQGLPELLLQVTRTMGQVYLCIRGLSSITSKMEIMYLPLIVQGGAVFSRISFILFSKSTLCLGHLLALFQV